MEYCDQLCANLDLSATALFLLANAYMLLDQPDLAEQLCRRGMAMEPLITTLDDLERLDEGRRLIAGVLGRIRKARGVANENVFI